MRGRAHLVRDGSCRAGRELLCHRHHLLQLGALHLCFGLELVCDIQWASPNCVRTPASPLPSGARAPRTKVLGPFVVELVLGFLEGAHPAPCIGDLLLHPLELQTVRVAKHPCVRQRRRDERAQARKGRRRACSVLTKPSMILPTLMLYLPVKDGSMPLPSMITCETTRSSSFQYWYLCARPN